MTLNIRKLTSLVLVTISCIIIYEIYLCYINPLVILGCLLFCNLIYKKKVLRTTYNYSIIINTIVLIYIFILQGNIYSLIQVIRLYNLKLQSEQPTPPHIIKKANSIIRKRVSPKLKSLIDFGCGSCSTLSQLDFHYKIGVEYDKNIYRNALNEIKYKKYRIDEIINCNILDYDFKNDCIIYMYEPLWNINDGNKTYMKLFKNLKNTNCNIDIIYITGLTSKKLDDSFFRKYNFNVIEKTKIGSIFLNRTFFYCKKYKI